MLKRLLLVNLCAAFINISVWAAHFEIDPDHSSVNFKVRHLVSKVNGKFDKFKGSFEYEAGTPKTWKTAVSIDTASINTANKKRDDHLRSPDFFDVTKFSAMTFESTEITDATNTTAKLHGKLTIHGVTKPVVLGLEMGGVGVDPWGNKRAGFSATTKINRKDFGINWNKTLDKGGVLLGEEIEVSIEIEGIAK